jgi:hypothetical protein
VFFLCPMPPGSPILMSFAGDRRLPPTNAVVLTKPIKSRMVAYSQATVCDPVSNRRRFLDVDPQPRELKPEFGGLAKTVVFTVCDLPKERPKPCTRNRTHLDLTDDPTTSPREVADLQKGGLRQPAGTTAKGLRTGFAFASMTEPCSAHV